MKAIMVRRFQSGVAQVQRSFHEIAQSVSAVLGPWNLLIVSEGQSWILDDFSQSLLSNLPGELHGRTLDIVPVGVRNKVIHFVERYRYLRLEDPEALANSNDVVITWWHGGASGVQHLHLNELLSRISEIATLPIRFHITSSLYNEVLLNCGVSSNRILHLPMGVDLRRFAQQADRAAYKTRLGIPHGKLCVGYFQRDGDAEPKLVKGPDVFIDTIRQMWSQRDDLLILLTGPKRGYVRRCLEELGVPYHYAGFVPMKDMPAFYYASDLYLITSREEGGPAAVLECMATGTPLISTRVGMAVDVIQHGKNGYLTDLEDISALADHALMLIKNPSIRMQISEAAKHTALRYDWPVIAPRYARELYDFHTPPVEK